MQINNITNLDLIFTSCLLKKCVVLMYLILLIYLSRI